MTIDDAQADLRRAYMDAGPGTVISGLVWIAAAVAQSRGGIATGFAVLFFGGMLIYPLSLLVNRSVLKRVAELPENPLGRVVLESTIAMIGGLVAAWLFLPHDPELVMPLAALAVGAHYFAFRTAYGMAIFWVLAAVLVGLSGAAIFGMFPFGGSFVLLIGAIEIVFGIYLTIRAK